MWRNTRKKWWPGSLKNRMVAAYVLLVLIPFSGLCLIGFNQIEQVLKQNQITQNSREVEGFRSDLLDLTGLMTRSLILINQNPAFEQYLSGESGGSYHAARREIIRNLDSLANSFFLSTPSVYFTVTDTAGNAFFNYTPRQVVDGGRLYGEILEHTGGGATYRWQEAPTYIAKDIVPGDTMLTIDSILLNEQREPFGSVRISIDHQRWLAGWARGGDRQGSYLVARADGGIVFRSAKEANMPEELIRRLTAELKAHPDKTVHYVSNQEQALYLGSYLSSLDWMLVKKISLQQVFAETNSIKQNVFIGVILLTAVFIAATLLIASAITKPLHRLRKVMTKAADNELKVTLPTDAYSGEILQLVNSFNVMIADIQNLIYRLKVEERQKESSRFQILVSQMDPHFLLNTLNMIKSQALRNKDEITFDICVSLGLLLETSLNTEVDLVPLGQELSFTEAYMHIQNTRFSNRFKLDIQYDESLYYTLVPKFTLQPLVENAIIHGFAVPKRNETITISIQRSGKQLLLLVTDNGQGVEGARKDSPSVARKRKGIGLANIRERLELLYRGVASLELEEPQSNSGTTVKIVLPLLISEPYQKEEKTHV
ncbi:sensor histidine kinase [Paenibacillus sp. CAU 1782]